MSDKASRPAVDGDSLSNRDFPQYDEMGDGNVSADAPAPNGTDAPLFELAGDKPLVMPKAAAPAPAPAPAQVAAQPAATAPAPEAPAQVVPAAQPAKQAEEPAPQAAAAATPEGKAKRKAPKAPTATDQAKATQAALAGVQATIAAQPDRFDGSPEHHGAVGENTGKLILAEFSPVIEQLIKSVLQLSVENAKSQQEIRELKSELEALLTKQNGVATRMEDMLKASVADNKRLTDGVAAQGVAIAGQYKAISEGITAIKTTGDHTHMRVGHIATVQEGILKSMQSLNEKCLKPFLEGIQNSVEKLISNGTAETLLKYSLAALGMLVGLVLGGALVYWGYCCP